MKRVVTVERPRMSCFSCLFCKQQKTGPEILGGTHGLRSKVDILDPDWILISLVTKQTGEKTDSSLRLLNPLIKFYFCTIDQIHHNQLIASREPLYATLQVCWQLRSAHSRFR